MVSRKRQAGGLTIFSAVVMLALMTLMLVYATRTQQAEQRMSGNEYRQKLAFHAAETGVEQAQEYLIANSLRVLSASETALPDGSGGTRAGWFAASDGRWATCPADPPATHPCGGEFPAGATANSYYYDDPDTTTGGAYDFLPLETGVLPAGSTVRVTAVMCIVDFETPTGGCGSAPAEDADTSQNAFLLTVLAYGYADCTDTSDPSTCLARANIAVPLTNFNVAQGAPAVPLTTKTTFPPTGTAEIVPNPDAGGVGVPVSAWINENASCSTGAVTLTNGSWATCEYHEWYERDLIPDGMACDQPTCSCSASEAISYTAGTNDFLGIDLLPDDEFPCDLIEFFFGVPRSQYQLVKASAKVIPNCDDLDENSFGFYWVSGSDCTLGGNTQIGTPERPVMIVSAASRTNWTGFGTIFGVVFVTDVEDANATWDASGTNIVYGAVIVDAELDGFVGTFQIVWNEDAALLAASSDGLGTLAGGWRDFGLPALTWES